MSNVSDKIVNFAGLEVFLGNLRPPADLADVLSYLSTSDPYSINNDDMIATLSEVQVYLGLST